MGIELRWMPAGEGSTQLIESIPVIAPKGRTNERKKEGQPVMCSHKHREGRRTQGCTAFLLACL
jgi:hypothetical protein